MHIPTLLMERSAQNTMPIAELAKRYPAPWVQRAMQASLLLTRKSELNALPSMMPSYDAIASQVDTFSFDRPIGTGFQTTKENISFEALLAERNALSRKLLPSLHTLQDLISTMYAIDDPNKPTIANTLSEFINYTHSNQPYQHTVEKIYQWSFDNVQHNAIAGLKSDMSYVPTEEQLRRTGHTREETMAQFYRGIAALQDAYEHLQVFQARAKALHEKVLPKLQEQYTVCANILENICTSASEGILENPTQYFAPGKEQVPLPNQCSLALGPLRSILLALRCKDGGHGLSPAKTVRTELIEGQITHALQKAENERRDIATGGNDTAILQTIDAALAPAAAEVTVANIAPSSSSETVHTVGGVNKRRNWIATILGR